MSRPLRLTSVMGVARAMFRTVSVPQAVDVLVEEFGWDATFLALSLLRGDDAERGFAEAWSRLVTDPIAADLASEAFGVAPDA